MKRMVYGINMVILFIAGMLLTADGLSMLIIEQDKHEAGGPFAKAGFGILMLGGSLFIDARRNSLPR